MEPLKQVLQRILSAGIVKVVFTKIDGSERTMLCTKNLNHIPTESHPTGKSHRQERDDLIRVYDTVEQGWRSFIVDNVISYEEVA